MDSSNGVMCCSGCIRRKIKDENPHKSLSIRKTSLPSHRPTFKTAFRSTMKVRKMNKRIYEQNVRFENE